MSVHKDLQGRVLQKGETQRRSDKRYVYTYRDMYGYRRCVYAADLTELRRKEEHLIRDQVDGVDTYVSGVATLNYAFDRYMSVKKNLRPTTHANYLYMYDHFVRKTIGRQRIVRIKYSDILRFYNHLLEQGMQVNTLDSIHTLLHPTFQMAVRDQIIRINPTDGVMAEVKKATGHRTNVRHALTIDQQRIFMRYVAGHPTYHHWWPLFALLLGTGCRIGEAVGLRWQDVDLDKEIITIDHSLVYYPTGDNRTSVLHVSLPKTEAGIRTIPILPNVRKALEMTRAQNRANERDGSDVMVDGMSGFIFVNRYGTPTNQQAVNSAIKRIVSDYNAEEELAAARQRREPILLSYFSAHILRHTSCTRMCENETNLKVIQAVMGHRDIQTTMDIYAEATEDKKQESFERLVGKIDVF